MATGTYFLICEAGKVGGFGPYIGVDPASGIELIMVPDRTQAKRYLDRKAAETDATRLATEFGALDIEERFGLI